MKPREACTGAQGSRHVDDTADSLVGSSCCWCSKERWQKQAGCMCALERLPVPDDNSRLLVNRPNLHSLISHLKRVQIVEFNIHIHACGQLL